MKAGRLHRHGTPNAAAVGSQLQSSNFETLGESNPLFQSPAALEGYKAILGPNALSLEDNVRTAIGRDVRMNSEVDETRGSVGGAPDVAAIREQVAQDEHICQPRSLQDNPLSGFRFHELTPDQS